MVALVYGLSHAASHSWSSAGTVVPLAVGVLLLAVFVLVEIRSPEPLMPLAIFNNRNRAGTYAMMLCIATALFSLFFFLTQFLQNVLGWSALKTGVGFLPMTIAIAAAAGAASVLVGKIGIRVPLLIGPAAAVIGLLWLTRLTPSSGYADVIGPLIIVALGLGFAFVPLTLTAVSGVRPEETGLASALLNTSQQIGGALGLAVLATIAITATKNQLSGLHGPPTQQAVASATTHGYTTAFAVGAGVALLGFIISLLVIRTPQKAPAEAQPHAGSALGM
jgi:predicted MFS family arabinose efflux permease